MRNRLSGIQWFLCTVLCYGLLRGQWLLQNGRSTRRSYSAWGDSVSNLDLVQIEQLKLIGAQLHQTRQEQAKPLEEIAAVTYIPLRILRALEGGQVEILPEPVFIQGFIRRYADVLGLDGHLLSKEFPVNAYSSPHLSTTKSADLPPAKPRSIPRRKVLSKKSSSSYLAPTVISIGVVAGLVYGLNAWMKERPGWLTANPLAGSAQAPRSPKVSPQAATSPRKVSPATLPASPAPANPSPAAATQPSSPPSPAVTPSNSPTAIASSPTSPMQVSLNLSGDSWVRVRVDGQTEFEGILKAGEQRSWSAKQTLTIRAGNAGVVSVAVNGGTAQPMGSVDAVEEITLTPATILSPSSTSSPQP